MTIAEIHMKPITAPQRAVGLVELPELDAYQENSAEIPQIGHVPVMTATGAALRSERRTAKPRRQDQNSSAPVETQSR